jgi:hypothetical protein
VDSTKLQGDDDKLRDFIKDKYERKRWVAKGKDPMTLIIEGKDVEATTRDKSSESEDNK